MLTIEQIISTLNIDNDSIFPRESLEHAVLQKEVITPALLTIIDTITEDPELLESNPAFIYALYLLAQFREARAYPVIARYFRELGLEDEALDPTGDTVTEDLNSILASVCQGDLSLIKQLIEDQSVNEYVRTAALGALIILYNTDQLSRESLVSYMGGLLEHCLKQEEDPFFVATLVCNACSIYPRELYLLLDECFQQDLVYEEVISKAHLEDYMKMDKATVLAELKENRQYQLINNVITEMAWWSCFHPKANADFEHDSTGNVGRNDPCFCGSGKKYKKCCLQ